MHKRRYNLLQADLRQNFKNEPLSRAGKALDVKQLIKMEWTRPAGPPRVWDIRDLKSPDGKIVTLTFQELSEDRHEEALEKMCSQFFQDEAMCSSINVMDDEASVATFRTLWSNTIAKGISVGAFLKEKNSEKPLMVAVNLLGVAEVHKKKKLSENAPGKAKKIMGVFDTMIAEADCLNFFHVDRYLSSCGLIVDPKYRRMGIATCFLKLRDKIGQAYNFPLTLATFTSMGSQRAAALAGFKDRHVRFYNEFQDDNGELLFPSLTDTMLKVMVKHLPKTLE